jgi:hypothetical protein
MQYTLRRIPTEVDRAVRRRAREQGRTISEVAIEAMAEGLGLKGEPARRRSVQDLLGARGRDRELEAALAEQRNVDPELWR